MDTYSVKQLAELLDTNPETVRRWIRNKKLKAVQVSRKDGNVITEAELQRFLKAAPKYLPKAKVSYGLASASPVVGMAVFAGGLVASALMGFISEKNEVDVRILPEDFKLYLKDSILKFQKLILNKKGLIAQTEKEIADLEKQIEQYQYLIEHDELINKTIEETMDREKEEGRKA